MTKNPRRVFTGPLVPLSALLLSLLLSLLLYLLLRPEVDGRVFFYPVNSGTAIGSERRGIPSRRGLPEQIDVFVQELLIGPVDLSLAKTAPRGTNLNHAMMIDKTMYIDLGIRMLDADSELPISFDEALGNIRYNVLFNFPRVEDVVFTVGGQQVHAPYYK